MKKSLLSVTLLAVLFGGLSSYSLGDDRRMSAKQQEACRTACLKNAGWKWDPTSADNRKGCTCRDEGGNEVTITDYDLGEKRLDNVVSKTKQ
ncbi:MAG: hypothetical protein A2977_01765 [Alphaproteobacteria bacterium RIFCSPLOWO2_01_FULL_45_8]|nr:MAG: hypothetical protein A2065_02635 [Alphaproteobacteria bacterium GWB1_45_5]OFW75896.1 MAG: hypothetical protein A3K20_03665 [Alphaproteobacteria bacterium GWA1_45_9]OFW89988.1 MAG: hypothetical protein A2621_03870 [Alphaproteobacteria bacterium RIFCSPHIGHO2_01_FULL_41_14]OFW96009.1 MAG: hypothetical protein A2977_01765 [Alphaproteobacteria bacterium RIFCSPLOWO2_01_FULL_45_8]HCI48506.1 hypothetical protein [Holosporales bacterium]